MLSLQTKIHLDNLSWNNLVIGLLVQYRIDNDETVKYNHFENIDPTWRCFQNFPGSPEQLSLM